VMSLASVLQLVGVVFRFLDYADSLVAKLDRDVRRLEDEEEAAAEAARELAESARELLAKSFRLRKQKRLLTERRSEMLSRGFSSLEEMEKEDREEAAGRERERIEREALPSVGASVSVGSPAPLDLALWADVVSPSFWAVPDSGDGTVLPSSSTS